MLWGLACAQDVKLFPRFGGLKMQQNTVRVEEIINSKNVFCFFEPLRAWH